LAHRAGRLNPCTSYPYIAKLWSGKALGSVLIEIPDHILLPKRFAARANDKAEFRSEQSV
jgi:hypothetical protein